MGFLRKRKKVSFYGTRVVKVPVRVSFRTREGGKVTFGATRAVRRRKKVSFWTR